MPMDNPEGLKLIDGVEVLLKNDVRSATMGNACLFDAFHDLPHLFNSQLGLA